MTPVRRMRLGRKLAIFHRSTLHAIEGGFEQEVRNGVDVVKTRVLHDDVAMVSLHRHVSTPVVVVHASIALFVLSIAAMVSLADDGGLAATIVAFFAVPFLVVLAVHLLARVDTVTITGRRSRVSADYVLAKRRARQVHDDAVARVRHRHRQLEGEAASEEAAPT